MGKTKFEWELRCIWHFGEATATQVVGYFACAGDAVLCAKALQKAAVNREYTVRAVGGVK